MHNIKLPPHVHRYTSGSKVYYSFQKNRGTERAGDRTRIPYDPTDERFWKLYNRLCASTDKHPGTIFELVREYRAHKLPDFKPATQRDYDSYLTFLEDEVGPFQTFELTTPAVQKLHDLMKEQSKTRARHLVSVVRSLCKFGMPRGLIGHNPARDVDMVKVKVNPSEPWPQWAIDLIFEHARWEVQTFVSLGLYTGQRSQDILDTKLSDVKGNTISVVQSKTDKRLMVPVHRNLLPTIHAARDRGYEWFVPRPDGTQLDGNSWRAMWGRELRKAPLRPIRDCTEPKIKPHGLCKNAHVSLREAGCSIEDIMSITGRSRQMVEYYCRDYDQAKMAKGALLKWESKTE